MLKKHLVTVSEYYWLKGELYPREKLIIIPVHNNSSSERDEGTGRSHGSAPASREE